MDCYEYILLAEDQFLLYANFAGLSISPFGI